MSSLIAGIPKELIPIIILMVSILGLTIILERAWALLKKTTLLDTEDERQLLTYIKNSRFDDAIAFCRLQTHPAYHVAKTVIESRDLDIDLVSLADEETLRQVSSLEKYLPTLGTISTVAPLLGLLGTVTGMIKSFRAFEENAARSTQMMGGIDEALLTTALGLIVAIPALIMYNYFVRRVNTLSEETGILSQMVLEQLKASK